jgi:hypothetical protein
MKPQDRLPPFEQLETLRSELESDFAGGIEQRRRNKQKRIDEILEMLIIAYMFGNEAGNYMLSSATETIQTVADQTVEESPEVERTVDIEVDAMNDAIYRRIADKTWEQRVSEYMDADNGTVDEIVRVVDTDLNRVYNDSILDVGERADGSVMKTWQTMEDERVRSTHDYINGMTIPVDKRFWTWDGDSARYPGDFTLAENNVNCRCRISLSMA